MKIKRGKILLQSNNIGSAVDTLQLTFLDHLTYIEFKQELNYLIVKTFDGNLVIEFDKKIPKVKFKSYNSNKLILKLK